MSSTRTWIIGILVALVVLLAAGAFWVLDRQRVADSVENGVVAFKKGDYAQAINILQPLAESGNPTAQLTLGTMYAFGNGVAPDRNKARTMLQESLGERAGDFYLWIARSYETGDGVDEDKVEALQWYTISAEAGNDEAKRVLQEPAS